MNGDEPVERFAIGACCPLIRWPEDVRACAISVVRRFHNVEGGLGSDREDLLQISWIRAAEALAQGRWRPGYRWTTYADAVCRNAILEVFRTNRKKPKELSLDSVGLLAGRGRNASEDLEFLEVVRTALHTVPSDDAFILTRRHIDGWTLAQIAEFLGCSPPTASRKLVRAEARVRHIFEELGFDEPVKRRGWVRIEVPAGTPLLAPSLVLCATPSKGATSGFVVVPFVEGSKGDFGFRVALLGNGRRPVVRRFARMRRELRSKSVPMTRERLADFCRSHGATSAMEITNFHSCNKDEVQVREAFRGWLEWEGTSTGKGSARNTGSLANGSDVIGATGVSDTAIGSWEESPRTVTMRRFEGSFGRRWIATWYGSRRVGLWLKVQSSSPSVEFNWHGGGRLTPRGNEKVAQGRAFKRMEKQRTEIGT
jgi:RNA polymerase sigma factor (sigma-70 family)